MQLDDICLALLLCKDHNSILEQYYDDLVIMIYNVCDMHKWKTLQKSFVRASSDLN